MEGLVFDLRRYSTQDGPGIRTTVFLKGCPLRCQWCHNPESQSFSVELMRQPELCIGCGRCAAVCPVGLAETGACLQCGACAEVCPAQSRVMAGKVSTTEAVMQKIRRDILFYDQSEGGVTFSGGEPLCQAEFLLELLRSCGKEGIHRAVDTSGFAAWEVLQPVAAETDLFLYDLKIMDNGKHKVYTGVENGLILDNLAKLMQRGNRGIVRMPLIPGINDDTENLHAMGRFLASAGGNWPVNLLPFHQMQKSKYEKLHRQYKLAETAIPTAEQMEAAILLLRSYGLQVSRIV